MTSLSKGRPDDGDKGNPAARTAGILIVGGGPAGCAAAISLGAAGVHAELIERSHKPHDVVCGGFLGWDALHALQRLGIDAASLGARPIHRLRLVSGRHCLEVPLPGPAAGLSRRRLDSALLVAAAEAGATVRRGKAVRAADTSARKVRLDDDEEIAAEMLLLATGKHELRGAVRPRLARRGSIGVRTSITPSASLIADLEGTIELHLFDHGYAGLLLQEDGTINLCLSVAAHRLKRAGGIAPLVEEIAAEAPSLGDRLDGTGDCAWTAISDVPYGWRARTGSAGLFRLGDQAAVIASIAGDGIAIALESGMAAAAAIAEGRSDSLSFQRDFARRSKRPVAIAEVLRRAAEHGPARTGLMSLLRFLPGLVPYAARLTRIGG